MTETLKKQLRLIRIEVAIGAGTEGEIGEGVKIDKSGKTEKQTKRIEIKSGKGIEIKKKTTGMLMLRIEVGEIRKRTGIERTIQRDLGKGRDRGQGPMIGERRQIKGKAKKEVLIGIRQRTDMLIEMDVTKVESWKGRVIDSPETKKEFEKGMTEEEEIGNQTEGHLAMIIAIKTIGGSICLVCSTKSVIWSSTL